MALRFTVGQLAKLNNLSKQALIYYDKEGVFCPKYTDPNNGYRYYTADQLEVLDSILILKEIGLSLSEIRSFMEGRSEENALTMLKQQHTKLTDKINSLSLIAGRLSHKISTLEHLHDHSTTPEWIYLEEAQPLTVQAVQAPGGLLEVDFAIKKLFQKVQNSNYLHFYQIGTMISSENLERGNFLNASYSFFPLEDTTHDKLMYRPSGWHVRCFHKGAYENVGSTYSKMLQVISEKNCKPCGYSYEYCVLDSLTSKSTTEYVTEIYLSVSTPT